MHVGRPGRTRPLLVGGNAWVIDLGLALRSAGLEVLMWAALDGQREQISQAGLELAPGELLAAATGRGKTGGALGLGARWEHRPAGALERGTRHYTRSKVRYGLAAVHWNMTASGPPSPTRNSVRPASSVPGDAVIHY